MSLRKKDSVLLILNGSLVDLPSPSNLSYFWNFGSLLGVFMVFQILSGLFLSFHFSGDVSLSFLSVIHMMRDVNYGWVLRVLHANGAGMFFLFIYMHMGRGLYYGSYRFYKTWMSGVTILLLSMAIAFLGYVLPWGQMSFWAATVITSMFSAIPYVGLMLVEWIWGGFAVNNPTLIRFFAFHFVFPFILVFLVVLHLLFLHEMGSGNPIGITSNNDKIIFHPYYTNKDVFGFIMCFIFYIEICFLFPYIFMDVENFIFYNPLVTPTHIQPEWYFLFAYTILRSVPSKIGGVIALIMSIFILYFLPLFLDHRFRSNFFYFFMKFMFWFFIVNWVMLTWIGACEVELPFSTLGIYFSLMYFILYICMYMICMLQDLMLGWF